LSRRRLAALIGALLSLGACSPAGLLNATIARAGLAITQDVAYGPDPRQKLDIYRPAGDAKLPVIVFFYGGSWKMGSKATYPFVAATLARQGNVVVVPDYRLYPQVTYPAFLQDCASATAWVAAHTQQIGAEGHRLFLMGHSAGAYNAAMLALNPDYLTAAGVAPGRVAGLIGLAGPYDFTPSTDPDVHQVFAPAPDAPTQPITYAGAHAPPMLLLAGDADTTVRPRNTRALADRVRAAGGAVETRFYPGVAHIGLVLAIAPVFQGKAPVLADIQAFIRQHPP